MSGDPFSGVNTFEYEYTYNAEDIKTMVSEAIAGKADSWEREAAEESLKGAANQGMMNALKWGAAQLREIASLVAAIPSTETRTMPISELPPGNFGAPVVGANPQRINDVSERYPVAGPRKMFDASSGKSEEIDNPYMPLAGGLNVPVEIYTVPDFDQVIAEAESPLSFDANVEIVEPGSSEDLIFLQPDDVTEVPAAPRRGRPKKVVPATEPASVSDEREGGDVQ